MIASYCRPKSGKAAPGYAFAKLIVSRDPAMDDILKVACLRRAEAWTRRTALNVARCGRFFSDRTVREYCTDIWRARPVPSTLLTREDERADLPQ